MRRLATICAGLLVAGGAWAQPPRYQVHSIEGPPGCETTVPQALDDGGRVVGGRCLWNPSGTLPAPDAQHPEAFADSIARGVAAGHAVDEDLLAVPVFWVSGKAHVLPLAPGFRQGLALLINARRDVLGQMSGGSAGTQVTLWPRAGAPTAVTLTPKASNRDLRAMNDHRQVVGCASFSGVLGGEIVPFLWSGGQTRLLEPASPGDPGGCAYAINDEGVVAGESGQRPVLWRDGSVEPLAAPGHTGQVLDVNDHAAAVGVLDGRSFYWDGTRVWDLLELIDDPAQAATVGRVIAINDRGQILATRPTPAAPLAGVVLLEPAHTATTCR